MINIDPDGKNAEAVYYGLQSLAGDFGPYGKVFAVAAVVVGGYLALQQQIDSSTTYPSDTAPVVDPNAPQLDISKTVNSMQANTEESAGEKDKPANGDKVKDKHYPANPDDYKPDETIGEKEETKTKDATDGKKRHWKDQNGDTSRKFDKGDPNKTGWKGKDHWHDRDHPKGIDYHIEPK